MREGRKSQPPPHWHGLEEPFNSIRSPRRLKRREHARAAVRGVGWARAQGEAEPGGREGSGRGAQGSARGGGAKTRTPSTMLSYAHRARPYLSPTCAHMLEAEDGAQAGRGSRCGGSDDGMAGAATQIIASFVC